MKIKLTSQQSLSHEVLAQALAESEADEFADFWFALADFLSPNDEKMNNFAIKMAKDLGSKRRDFYKKFYELIIFYEIEAKKKENP